MKKGTIFSGMRPTGKLHLGHYSVLENWMNLQDDYDCYFGVADWHALTTGFNDTQNLQENIFQIVLDWLSVGIDPEKSPVFVQSQIKEHAELHLLLSMITPVSWLERVPTYKEQLNQFGKQGKDISTYGFFGYPLLMAADILAYFSDFVPVGEDQLPHLEFSREVARRFNHLYDIDLFPEPQALLAKIKLLPGIDNRKMSKSYGNDIAINASEQEIKEKVQQMVTDASRIKKTDLGHPEICTVFAYHGFYNKEEQAEIECACKKGKIGCVQCKKKLAKALNDFIEPIREKRADLEQHPERVKEILAAGAEVAREKTGSNLAKIREAMNI